MTTREKFSLIKNKYPSSWLSSMMTRGFDRDWGKGGRLGAKGTETGQREQTGGKGDRDRGKGGRLGGKKSGAE